MGWEDGVDTRADGKELGFEDGTWMCLRIDFFFWDGLDAGGRVDIEEKVALDVGRDDLREGEVEAQRAVVGNWSTLHELVVLLPVGGGVLVSDLFTG